MLITPRRIQCLVVAWLLTPVPGFADEPATAAAPVFRALGPDATDSVMGVDLALLAQTDDPGDPLARLELHGQLAFQGGLGGYASVAVGHADGWSGVGNIEVGGMFGIPAGAQGHVSARAGVIVPTASREGGDSLILIANLYADPSDLVLGVPDVTAFRFAISPGWTDGTWFVRGDAGVDLLLADGTTGKIVHLDGAIGWVRGHGAAAFELQNVMIVDAPDGDLYHHAGLTVQHLGERTTLYGGLGMPFGHDVAGKIVDLTLGVRGRL